MFGDHSSVGVVVLKPLNLMRLQRPAIDLVTQNHPIVLVRHTPLEVLPDAAVEVHPQRVAEHCHIHLGTIDVNVGVTGIAGDCFFGH